MSDILKFGVNLLYRFYSGKDEWLEEPNFNEISQHIISISKELHGCDIFNRNVKLPKGFIKSPFSEISFRPIPPNSAYFKTEALVEDRIIFPTLEKGKNKKDDNIAQEISNLYTSYKGNPNALLMILEKYGTFVPISSEGPLSLFEHFKFLEAIAQCGGNFLLAVADFSGIQDFIYTISSKGVLKSVRARSFFLSLLSEHIVYEILKKENLNRASIIFLGGGSFCLLLPKKAEETLGKMKREINSYFLNNLAGKLYLGFVWSECKINDLNPPNFRNKWIEIGKLLEEDKHKKFIGMIDTLFAVNEPKQKTSEMECQICHRDDHVQPADLTDLEGNIIKVCPLCKTLFYLGDALTDYNYINRWKSQPSDTEYYIGLPSILNENAYYWIGKEKNGEENWIKNSFQPSDCLPFYGADYVTQDDGKTADFEYLAKKSEGKTFVGCLIMDVDYLGAIFLNGIKKEFFTPTTLSSLSNAFNRFFTIYMNLICEGKIASPLLIPSTGRSEKRNVSIIYSGGDDLLIVGAWNEIGELSLDIARNFRRYTGGNYDITISGGNFLAHPKFPFYRMVRFSREALEIAKRNYDKCLQATCCTNFSNCYFYEAGATPMCRIKDSGLLFYSPSRESKRIELEKDPATIGRIKTAMKWDEIECKVIKPLETMYPIFRQPLEERFSRSFIYRLFSLINKWEKDGILYLALMSWVIERLKKMTKPEVTSQVMELSSILFNPKYMNSLFIPLTWLDLLKRKRR